MRRAERLFEIIQILRQSTAPLTADAIATELEIGKRTIYRDIAALVARRVPIRGEAGIGYVLERGFDLPPLMLNVDEVEAVTLGAQWVIANGDSDLARAAMSVLAKVAAVVPKELMPLVDDPSVVTLPRQKACHSNLDYQRLRRWCREGRKIAVLYRDKAGAETYRTLWPFMMGYVTGAQVVIAWCEMREDFRVFREDRIKAIEFFEGHYTARAATLRRQWMRYQANRQMVETT
ncbi:DNA-binding protein [Pseudomonas straminea]|uniref:WYL domain-containing protein n=1 Tax=Pseudomonas straminea TaxID=47882 RepID=A0A1I1WC57_PSEOC|nr:YafY family protein [Pseudomonas straminea]GLX14759.1 DNA-binding protein [Pseudomonas straminea]SFD92727.1 WYL domain-containing protein [Pseudomonas straminea]